MTTIIRRYPRRSRQSASAAPMLAMALLGLALVAIAGVLLVAWQRGGPLPVREIAVQLPTPVRGAGK